MRLCCRFKNSEYCCPSFNVKTKQCMNYAERFSKEICLPVRPDNVLSLHAKGILPDSCAYVRHAKKKPPLEPEEVALVPFALAPLSVRRRYEKARKRWLRGVKNRRRTQQ